MTEGDSESWGVVTLGDWGCGCSAALCLCLNFLSHLVLKSFSFPSARLVADKCTPSRIISSVRQNPCFWWFWAQLDRSLSTLGSLRLTCLGGFGIRSVFWYMSFWRRTFETVLNWTIRIYIYFLKVMRALPPFHSKSCCSNLISLDLHSGILTCVRRSTLPAISFCFAVLCSSW